MGVSSWESCWKKFLLVLKDAKVHPHLALRVSAEDGDDEGVTTLSSSWLLGAHLRITEEREGDEVSLWGELLFCSEWERVHSDGP